MVLVAETSATSDVAASTKARYRLTTGANAPFAMAKATKVRFAKHATVQDGYSCATAAMLINMIAHLR